MTQKFAWRYPRKEVKAFRVEVVVVVAANFMVVRLVVDQIQVLEERILHLSQVDSVPALGRTVLDLDSISVCLMIRILDLAVNYLAVGHVKVVTVDLVIVVDVEMNLAVHLDSVMVVVAEMNLAVDSFLAIPQVAASKVVISEAIVHQTIKVFIKNKKLS